MKAHVAFVAVAEVLDDVLGPLVGLGQQHLARVKRVDFLAQPPQVLVSLGQVFAVGAVALEKVRHSIEAETVEADVEPVADDVEHRVRHVRVVVIEVRLMGEEAVPVVLAPLRVPGPVGLLGVDENDAGLPVTLVVVAPHVPVGLRVGAVLAGLLEPGVLVARMVHDQVGDDPDPPPVGFVDQLGYVGHLAVLGQDGPVVGDVVPAVPQRGLVEGQQPETVDSQPLQVVQLADEARDVAGAVVVGVEEPSHQDLVENRPLVPADVLAGCTRDGRYPFSGAQGRLTSDLAAHVEDVGHSVKGRTGRKGPVPRYTSPPKARRTPRRNAPGAAQGLQVEVQCRS